MTPDKAKSLANDVACAIATLQAVADELLTAYPDSDYDYESQDESPPWQETAPPKLITFDEAQAVCRAKAQDGYGRDIKALIAKYGVKELSKVPQEQYPALLAEVEGLGK
jgi:hypothetical protein